MGRANSWEGTRVTLDGSELGDRARHPGRWRRVYALIVVLVMTGALVWQLWRDPGSDSGSPDVEENAMQQAQLETITAHQRTVATIVGPNRIRVVEHLTYPSPTDEVTLVSPERAGTAAAFAPTIGNVWVDSGTGPQTAEAPGPGGSVQVLLPEMVTEVTVGYLATGVVERTPGSVTARALALMTPLRAEGPFGIRAVEVRGVWVDNLGCLDKVGEWSACGTGTSLGWATSAEDAGLTDVIAQLTLPSR